MGCFQGEIPHHMLITQHTNFMTINFKPKLESEEKL